MPTLEGIILCATGLKNLNLIVLLHLQNFCTFTFENLFALIGAIHLRNKAIILAVNSVI